MVQVQRGYWVVNCEFVQQILIKCLVCARHCSRGRHRAEKIQNRTKALVLWKLHSAVNNPLGVSGSP